MEGFFAKPKKRIDYDNEEDPDWTHYLQENFERKNKLGSPFPGSSWNYQTHDSLFDTTDRLKKPDEDLHETIVKRLYELQNVDASLIQVIVLNGNVLLTGKVQSQWAKDKAGDLVNCTDGVWKVDNQLIIQPS